MPDSNRCTLSFHALDLLKLITAYSIDSPISILPDDVLRHLFRFTQESMYYKHQFTIRISHVCRLWRRIAIDYALLWHTIFYDGQGPDMMRTFLDRSKGTPLEIWINICAGGWRMMLEVVDAFLPRISQLKILSFTGPRHEMKSFLQYITTNQHHNLYAPKLEAITLNNFGSPLRMGSGSWFGGHTPKLQSLELFGGLIPLNQPLLANITSLSLDEYPPSQILPVIAQCPRIQELSLASFPRTGSLAIPTLRKLFLTVPHRRSHLISSFLAPETWDRLIELKVYDVQPGVLPGILRKTPQLKQLSISQDSTLSKDHPPFVIAPLKYLVYLDLDCILGTSALLSNIRTPILTDLRLMFGSGVPMLDFIKFLARNKPPLKSLHLRFFQPDIDELRLILFQLPLLKILSTQSTPEFGNNILQVFNRYPELCPCLRTLDIDGCDQNNKTELDAFISRRTQSSNNSI